MITGPVNIGKVQCARLPLVLIRLEFLLTHHKMHAHLTLLLVIWASLLCQNASEALTLRRQRHRAALALIPLIFQTAPTISRAADTSSVSIASSMTEISASYNQGNAYLMSGEFEKALTEFDRIILANPSASPDFYLSRGIVNEKLLKWDAALSDYNIALKLTNKNIFSKDDPVVYNNIANAYTGLQDWPNALKNFKYAIRLKSDFIAPQIGENLVLYQLGETNEAKYYFKQLIYRYPSFADGLGIYATILFAEGNPDEARLYWERCLENDSRYLDIDWVENIRRWCPRLVNELKAFKNSL